MSATTDATKDPTPARVRCKVWVERGPDVLLSEWRVELLEAVEATGSLAAAALKLGVPYRTAWERVREAEDRLGARLLASESGGADGGGSHLTPEAHDLIARFRRVTSGIADLVERRYRAELRDRLG
jgi:molybdate transport system regulatory protein